MTGRARSPPIHLMRQVIMTEIIGVRFKSGGKQYYFDPNGQAVAPGQGVIIETSRGLEYGECTQGNTMVEDEAVVQPLRPLVRLATEKDLDTVAKNREKEARAFSICQEKIAAHGLDMKLVEVEYNFEGNKILFSSPPRAVDFRALVKDLAGVFHARIELRQIGVRDEAKMLGGLGICGKPLLLRHLPGRVSAGVHQDGQNPEPVPQPHQDFGHLRTAHVLPEIRAGGL